jgi:hypothetical protein
MRKDCISIEPMTALYFITMGATAYRSLGLLDWSSEEDIFLASLSFGKSSIVSWCDISKDDDSIQ